MRTVEELMQTKVFTVGQDELIDRVFFLIHYEKIRHIPVMDGRKIVGIVSDRDLYKAIGPRSRRRGVSRSAGESQLTFTPRKVRHIMRRGVLTVEPKTDLGVAALLMAQKRIGGLPVVKRGRLVGIITATDLLRAYARLFQRVEKLTT